MVNENRGLAWCPWLPTRPGLLGHLHGLWIRAQAVFISFSSSICAETYCNIYINTYTYTYICLHIVQILCICMYICSWRFHGVFGWCVPVWTQWSLSAVRPALKAVGSTRKRSEGPGAVRTWQASGRRFLWQCLQGRNDFANFGSEFLVIPWS